MSAQYKEADSGWLNLNKPSGISSFKALSIVKQNLGLKKAGYIGTLDPIATGVLAIAIGSTTKLIPKCDDREKIYNFSVKWGKQTDTIDKDGKITHTCSFIPTKELLFDAIKNFIGCIEQAPPKFSAVHVNGKRAYALARSGISFELKPRQIFIKSIDLLSHDQENSEFQICCSRGTYIRSLTRDMANLVGSYAFVNSIKRLKSGVFTIENAVSIDEACLDCVLDPNYPFSNHQC